MHAVKEIKRKSGAVMKRPLGVCAVTRRRFPVGASPTRRPLQPEATGAAKEVTNWLKPSESVSRIGDSASVQAVTRVNAEQASKRTMRRPTPWRGQSNDQLEAREGQAGRFGVAERFVVPLKPGNAGGGKGPQFKTDAIRAVVHIGDRLAACSADHFGRNRPIVDQHAHFHRDASARAASTYAAKAPHQDRPTQKIHLVPPEP